MTNSILIEQVEAFQNLLISFSTGGSGENKEYLTLRTALLADPLVSSRLPRFVKTCRDLGQFWSFIKYEYRSYQERREFLWGQFRPILELLESGAVPADPDVSDILLAFDAEHVHKIWTTALNRRTENPEAAITSARTLLETVCKHILDESRVEYDDEADLPKLYRATAEVLTLAPSQHSQQIFKQILGGCQAVVEGLGAARNKLGDAHGKGKKPVRPAPRHAELAVNLAGAMALFLIRTWESRSSVNSHSAVTSGVCK